MKRVSYFLSFILLLCAGGCDVLGDESPAPEKSVPEKIVPDDTTGTLLITGTVVYVQLEGGFWAIEGKTADAEKTEIYDPINLPESFKVNGQRVRVQAKIRNDMISVHMVGPIIEISDIEDRN